MRIQLSQKAFKIMKIGQGHKDEHVQSLMSTILLFLKIKGRIKEQILLKRFFKDMPAKE